MAFPVGVTFGVTSHGGAYTKKVSRSKKMDRKDLMNSAGEIGVMHWYKTRTEFNVEGSGTLTVDTGPGASGLSTVTGGASGIDHVDIDEGNEEYASWKYGGINAPGAVTG